MIERVGVIASRVVEALRPGPAGRHRETRDERPHWTADELAALAACGDPNPWDNTITCSRPRHTGPWHNDNVHGQGWTDPCHHPGDNCTEPRNP